MTFIYALVSGELILYVGQTNRSLTTRAYSHRSKSNRTGSKYIPDYIDWMIKLLEECDSSVRYIREQFYYDNLKPLYNIVRPFNGLTQNERVKEYQQTDKYQQKKETYEFKKYNREAQRKWREKQKNESTDKAALIYRAWLRG